MRVARRAAALLCVGLLATLALSGCTNRSFFNAKNSSAISSLDDLPKLELQGFTLSRVVRNTQAPTSTFDLVGDGSGAFGQKCTAINTGTGNLGPSTCTCTYSYTKPGSTVVESFEAPTTYHESDLLRCLYVGIPAAVSIIGVRVHVTTEDAYSNEVKFRFSGNGITLDTASPLTYAAVQRYQCRQNIKVPLVFEPGAGKMYDPFQSQDPRNTYPLNYYTTNFGAAFAIHASGFGGAAPAVDYYCPAIPNDPAERYDLNIFSVAADSAGSKRIYPPTGSAFDRSNFVVAKSATGIFNVPVNAYVSPNIFSVTATAGNQATVPPIGYAASPIATGIPGQETCPDASIPIPQGYRWVKVWLFRMALPVRKFLSSVALQQLNGIFCSPGEWSNPNGLAFPEPGRFVFDSCATQTRATATPANTPTGATSLDTINSLTDRLASRYFEGTGMCVNIDPLASFGGPGRTFGAGAFAPYNFPTGSDIWVENDLGPIARDGSNPLPYSCRGPGRFDPTHLCQPTLPANPVLPPTPPAIPPGGVPYDNNLITGNIDAPETPRFDYLFVVTPPTVNSADMTSTASPAYYVYKPYRYMAQGDCNSPDPDAPLAAGDCNPQFSLRNYGVKFHDVSGGGDPPADDPNRPGNFPVCALQKM